MEKETGKTWTSEITYGDKNYYIGGNEYSAGEELDTRRSEILNEGKVVAVVSTSRHQWDPAWEGVDNKHDTYWSVKISVKDKDGKWRDIQSETVQNAEQAEKDHKKALEYFDKGYRAEEIPPFGYKNETINKINQVANMQSGDEFTYVVKKDIPGICKAGKYRFVCTQGGPPYGHPTFKKLDIISKCDDKTGIVLGNYATIIKGDNSLWAVDLQKGAKENKLNHFCDSGEFKKLINPNLDMGIPLELVRDVKIIKGRFHKEELYAMQYGPGNREVNYDDVCERGKTPDTKKYIDYLIDQHAQATTHSNSELKDLKALPDQEKKAAVDTLTKIADEVKTEGRWGTKIKVCCEALAKAIDGNKNIKEAVNIAKAQIAHYSSLTQEGIETTIRNITIAIKTKFPNLNKEVLKSEEKKPIVKVIRRTSQRGGNQR